MTPLKVTLEYLKKVFNPLYNVPVFTIRSDFFPAGMKDLFPLEFIIQYGVLPLGFKTDYRLFKQRKCLNIGIINPPGRKKHFDEIEKIARNKLGKSAFGELKIFRINVSDFIQVLDRTYGLGEREIRDRPTHEIDSSVREYLGYPTGEIKLVRKNL